MDNFLMEFHLARPLSSDQVTHHDFKDQHDPAYETARRLL
ncbi:hypothetical protein Z949_4123 [Sulfitobacter guttiformis KCTC 32187]|nr:hypothetical protein Z949_4123 [Sulfitobacter guttiformis KCTC 32187]